MDHKIYLTLKQKIIINNSITGDSAVDPGWSHCINIRSELDSVITREGPGPVSTLEAKYLMSCQKM